MNTQKETFSKSLVRILAISAVSGCLWFVFLYFSKKQTVDTMEDIYVQVINDSVAQYGIVKRNGTPIDVCVHAGLVSAAYIQAKDEPNYRHWKAVEKNDCAAAGMPGN